MDQPNFSTIRTVLKVQGFTTCDTVYLPCNANNVLDYLKTCDYILETHIITGIAYGNITLIKVHVKLNINPYDVTWFIRNSELFQGPIIVSDSESEL